MKRYQVIWGGKNNTIIPKNFCFPEETKIIMENNVIKEIQDVMAGDKVIAYEDESPVDTILGVEIFSVIHLKSKEKIYVSLEDIKE